MPENLTGSSAVVRYRSSICSLYSKKVSLPCCRSSSKLVPTRRFDSSSSVKIRKWEPKLGLPTAPTVPPKSVRPTVCSELSSSHGRSLCVGNMRQGEDCEEGGSSTEDRHTKGLFFGTRHAPQTVQMCNYLLISHVLVHPYLMKGECAAGPIQDICICYLLDLQIERIEEATACRQATHVSLPIIFQTATSRAHPLILSCFVRCTDITSHLHTLQQSHLLPM